MEPLSELEKRVGEYYDAAVFKAELRRLPEDFPVEYAITLRHLARHIPEGAVVAEIGVGGGHYTQFLAGRGCRLHLVDVSKNLLETVCAKLRAAGLERQILGAHHCSGTRLDTLAAGSCDAVLLMGPLYHLCRVQERRRAVNAAARALKPGGVLVAAGINRMCYLREQFRNSPELVLARRDFHAQHLEDGNLDPDHAPPIGFAHLTGAAEFRKLFARQFEEVALVAVESFTGPWQNKLNQLGQEQAEEWLDLVEKTATWPEAFGLADHYLFVGRTEC